MTCERTKRQYIKLLAATPEEIQSPEDRRLVRAHPEVLRDRVMISEPMWICGPGRASVECDVHLCADVATHECDGCDMPICAKHATNRGTQEVIGETGFGGPGHRRVMTEDTFDLCPFCLFTPGISRKKGRPAKGQKARLPPLPSGKGEKP